MENEAPIHVHHHEVSEKSHRRLLILLLPSIAFTLTLALLYHYTILKDKTVVIESSTPQMEMKQVTIGDASLSVFVADTPEEQTKGLGDRESLAADQGMLFPFEPAPKLVQFWMKDMRFPLDFIWVRDKKVFQLHTGVPSPTNNSDNLPLIIPNEAVDAVIEVNAGFVKTHNIKVSDPVNW